MPAKLSGKVELLSIPEVAARLGVKSRNHVYGLIRAGKLRAVNVAIKGSKTRVSEDDLAAYIKRHSTNIRRAS